MCHPWDIFKVRFVNKLFESTDSHTAIDFIKKPFLWQTLVNVAHVIGFYSHDLILDDNDNDFIGMAANRLD